MNFKLTDPRLLFKPDGRLEWQQEFAQIPFGYVEGKTLRVIFATRRVKDNSGNYNSFPAQAVFSLEDFSLLSLDQFPLMDLGQPGCFDESGVMPGSILKLDSGQVAMYYCGWSRSMIVPYRWSIGVAYLNQEGRFQRKSIGPIIGQSSDHPYLTASPVVSYSLESGYEMFHLTGVSWSLIQGKYEACYRITKSYSIDGINWRASKSLMQSVFWEDECQTSPNIIKIGSKRFMTFSYRSQVGFREHLDRNYKSALAEEITPNNWKVVQKKIGVTDASSQRFDIAYLNTFEYEGDFYGLYNYSMGFGTSGIYIAKVEVRG